MSNLPKYANGAGNKQDGEFKIFKNDQSTPYGIMLGTLRYRSRFKRPKGQDVDDAADDTRYA